MNRHRTLISLLLGSALLIQGFAVSAAVPGKSLDNPVAQSAQMNTPCQGQPHSDDGAEHCCNPGCPDMTMCTLAYLTVAPTPFTTVAAVGDRVPRFVLPFVTTQPRTSPFRPPITLHS